MGRRPKPRLEPSFGEGSKDSKNFTAKGTREVVRGDTYCVSGALCGEALEFLGLFPRGGSKPDLGWHLKISPFASLGSNAGVGRLRYVGALADFALIRRLRATFPLKGEGYHGRSVKYRDSADLKAR